MLRLSGLDASLLYSETPTAHMHVIGTLILDPTGEDSAFSFERFREILASRLSVIPQFRRRLVPAPLGIDHPSWIEDANFDLDDHLLHAAVPPPGGVAELCDFVGRFTSVQLDRSRPLWEMAVVEGLAGGRVAVITKLHHAIMDGGAGAEIMARIFDLTPDQPIEAVEDDWTPEEVPSKLRLAASATAKRVLRPADFLRAVRDASGGVVETVRDNIGGRSTTAKVFGSPRTAFNGQLTASRAVGFGQVELDTVKAIKSAFGTTVNDVILAASSAAARRLLLELDAMVPRPLHAAVPISVRTEGDDGDGGVAGGNQVSLMTVRLPVQMDDDAAVLDYVAADARAAKAVAGRIGAQLLQQTTDVLPPRLVEGLSMTMERVRLPDRIPPAFNMVVSNIAGPPIPLYCAGASVEAIYPMGPLMHGSGLNITALSNCGNLDIGVITCRDKAPQAQMVAEEFCDSIDRLAKAAEERSQS
ncbi:MAG: wax ester/triacylglycerol synthase family O-acyltransferase [Acidimicrobiia bacterium]|nr:wax ester/triacylglycerol synthase family O-acyltransferase [Acidimicrobiia bacterium]